MRTSAKVVGGISVSELQKSLDAALATIGEANVIHTDLTTADGGELVAVIYYLDEAEAPKGKQFAVPDRKDINA